jgi:hypothetical protein
MAVEGTGVGGIITPLISPGGIGESPGPTPTPIPGVHSLIIDPGDTPLSLMARPQHAVEVAHVYAADMDAYRGVKRRD